MSFLSQRGSTEQRQRDLGRSRLTPISFEEWSARGRRRKIEQVILETAHDKQGVRMLLSLTCFLVSFENTHWVNYASKGTVVQVH